MFTNCERDWSAGVHISRTAKEGGESVQRRHLAHAVLEQWQAAELPPPLCQSIIILVFSQDSMNVSCNEIPWHTGSAPCQAHTEKLTLFCPGLR